MGFSRQEYWSGLPRPSPDLPDPGIKPASLGLWQAGSLPLAPPGKPLIKDTLLQTPGLSVWLVGAVET